MPDDWKDAYGQVTITAKSLNATFTAAPSLPFPTTFHFGFEDDDGFHEVDSWEVP